MNKQKEYKNKFYWSMIICIILGVTYTILIMFNVILAIMFTLLIPWVLMDISKNVGDTY